MSARGERGETLVELLATIVIMSTAVIAVVAGIGVAITASDRNAKQVTSIVVARNYAEAIAAAKYVPCATSATYAPGERRLPGARPASPRPWARRLLRRHQQQPGRLRRILPLARQGRAADDDPVKSNDTRAAPDARDREARPMTRPPDDRARPASR